MSALEAQLARPPTVGGMPNPGLSQQQPITMLQGRPTREIWQGKSQIPCPSLGPKLFWTVQISLIEYQSFWKGPICFGWVQINLDRNDLDPTKTIWTVQNHFGLIE